MENDVTPPVSSGSPPVITPPPPPAPAPAPAPLPPPPARRPRSNAWMFFLIGGLALLAILAVVVVVGLVGSLGGMKSGGRTARADGEWLEESVIENHDSKNKIAVVEVDGVISGSGMEGGVSLVTLIKDQLDRAAEDHQVKAVILKVDSPGGEVLASDDIYRSIQKFQKESGKPVIASMGSMAASGGYYISAPCRWIVANELTLTGSIGVIMSGYNIRGLLDKIGVRPEVYKSGAHKDMLSFSKDPNDVTPEERMMVQKLIDETFTRFKEIVGEGRSAAAKNNKGKGRTLATDWESLADGRVLSGKQAFEKGFVDELGNLETAVGRAEEIAGIEDANLVRYQQPFSLSSLFHLQAKSETPALKVDVGMDLPRLRAGYMYFLSPTVVH